MRAIAFLLLGLLALTAARPACATIATPRSPAMMHAGHDAHSGCPTTPDRAAHHACASASCVGCALGFMRIALPAALIAPLPILPATAAAVALAGSSPAAAIPPPRPIA